MFGHKSFLKLGALGDASIMGLYKESYELESCSFGFSQNMNTDGKAQTEVHGKTISVSIPGIPSDEIIRWSIESHSFKDGTIVICDSNDMPLEKIYLRDTACIGMEIVYAQRGSGYITTKLRLQARCISVGDKEFDSHWTGFIH